MKNINELVNQLSLINSSLEKINISLQSESFFSSQLFGAIVGGLLGLLPFLYLLYKDRPIIKLKHEFIYTTVNSFAQKGISVTISNHGRRPITIKNFFFELKTKESLVFLDHSIFLFGGDMPKKLEESSSFSIGILAGDIARDILEKQQYPKYACFRDAVGKVYRCEIPQKFWENLFRKENSSHNN
jgi:hypothetical protein